MILDIALVIFAVVAAGQLAHGILVHQALKSAHAETAHYRDWAEFWARGVDSLNAELAELKREHQSEVEQTIFEPGGIAPANEKLWSMPIWGEAAE
jgi:hypothetical protein